MLRFMQSLGITPYMGRKTHALSSYHGIYDRKPKSWRKYYAYSSYYVIYDIKSQATIQGICLNHQSLEMLVRVSIR